jgi:hypothetical protein
MLPRGDSGQWSSWSGAAESEGLRAQDAEAGCAFIVHLLAMPRCRLDFERLDLRPRRSHLDGEAAG